MSYSGARRRSGRLMTIAYALWGLLLFLAFTVAYFPYGEVLATKLAPMGLQLSYQQARFRLPLGVSLRNVKVLAASPARGQALESQKLTLEPVFTSLLTGRPALAVGAELYGGHAQVFVSRAGPTGYEVRFEALALDLAKLARLADVGASLSGKLSASGLFDLNQGGAASAAGRFQFDGKNVAVRFGTGILSITFTELAGAFAVKPGILDVRRLHGRGPELGLDAQGAVRLAPSLALSTVNVTCQLAPTAAGRARLGVFLRLLPHPPGASPYLVRGPLLMPSIS
jgi:type II secretion system protein N